MGAAQDLIRKHSAYGNLVEAALGRGLLTRLGQGGSGLAASVLAALPSSDRDDVALAIVEPATDGALRRIAATDDGRRFLLGIVREMQDGWSTEREADALRRVMHRVTEVSTPVVQTANGPRIPVEVVTFYNGSSALDALGSLIGPGVRGHTAIVIGDLVYSFELQWQVGRTKSQYLGLRENRQRDALIQSLDIPLDDARKLQRRLNEASDGRAWGVGGDICTDATARLLEASLGKLDAGWGTQGFIERLRATNAVREELEHRGDLVDRGGEAEGDAPGGVPEPTHDGGASTGGLHDLLDGMLVGIDPEAAAAVAGGSQGDPAAILTALLEAAGGLDPATADAVAAASRGDLDDQLSALVADTTDVDSASADAIVAASGGELGAQLDALLQDADGDPLSARAVRAASEGDLGGVLDALLSERGASTAPGDLAAVLDGLSPSIVDDQTEDGYPAALDVPEGGFPVPAVDPGIGPG